MGSSVEALVGQYVDLRPLVIEDAALTFRWRASERARHLNASAPSVEAQAKWIEARPASERNWIIVLKGGKPIGMLSLVDIDLRNFRAETGRFLIGEEEEARGVPAAVEAMSLLYKFAFGELGLLRLYGTIAAENRRMVKWQKYLGMKEEGRLRDHYVAEHGFQDAIFLGLLKKEYEADFLPRARALMALGGQAG